MFCSLLVYVTIDHISVNVWQQVDLQGPGKEVWPTIRLTGFKHLVGFFYVLVQAPTPSIVQWDPNLQH